MKMLIVIMLKVLTLYGYLFMFKRTNFCVADYGSGTVDPQSLNHLT